MSGENMSRRSSCLSPPEAAAWFLGPKAENLDLFQKLVTRAIDAHAEARKCQSFPLDPVIVDDKTKQKESFKDEENRLSTELEKLCTRLQGGIPFFNYRIQMPLADTTMASNLGYIAGLLYNQNNCANMIGAVTIQLERECVKDLCDMVGFKTEGEHSVESPLAWGHLPNGGTAANLEGMWAARCLKYTGLAIQKMMLERFNTPSLSVVKETFTYRRLDGIDQVMIDATPWQVLNIPTDEAIDLLDKLHKYINKVQDVPMEYDDLLKMYQQYTMENQGILGFFESLKETYPDPKKGRWFVPGSKHYSCDKGNKLLGMGKSNMINIGVDKNARMDLKRLRVQLEECMKEQIPVIGITVLYGTTQEGSVDDMVGLLALRKEFEQMKDGLTFFIQVDAAWGAYYCSTMWDKSHNLLQLKSPEPDCSLQNFPSCRLSTHFEKQLRVLKYADQISLDPHKTGFCPYPAGGLLYRNGNIRQYLAQTAAYVCHGKKKNSNEEINLFGIDGSKPGAASAGVWLSHKVIGLNNAGYGQLLRQTSYSASVMYSMFVSLERPEDPFHIVPAYPIRPTKNFPLTSSLLKKIRKDIVEADTESILKNPGTMEFLEENGPDTLINCISANFRTWDAQRGAWKLNDDKVLQKKFMDALHMRISHIVEKPSYTDRGIQLILNSTTWDRDVYGEAFDIMKSNLGLKEEDELEQLKMIINYSMSPWQSAKKCFLRYAANMRNELYNAYGAVTDKPERLTFVSPCTIEDETRYENWLDDGFLFGELEASFSKAKQGQQYHAIGQFCVRDEDRMRLLEVANAAKLENARSNHSGLSNPYRPLRMTTTSEMTIAEVMCGLGDIKAGPYTHESKTYNQIHMPEIQVECSYSEQHRVHVTIKLKRVIRYHHLAQELVEEGDYPPSQEYLLYAYKNHAYLSHCPNRFPDFQQQIELETVPIPYVEDKDSEFARYYEEAMTRGVLVQLPQIESGGKPILKRGKSNECKDPIKDQVYNTVSWADQVGLTGEMINVTMEIQKKNKRWFDGQAINAGYKMSEFPMYFNKDGSRRHFPENDYEREE